MGWVARGQKELTEREDGRRERGSEDGIEKAAKKTVVRRDSATWNYNEACEANLATSHSSITCKTR